MVRSQLSATAASARGGCISPSTMANVHQPKLQWLHHVMAADMPAEATTTGEPNFEESNHRQEMPMQPLEMFRRGDELLARIRAEDAAEDARAAAAAAGASAGAAAAAGGGCISPSTTAGQGITPLQKRVGMQPGHIECSGCTLFYNPHEEYWEYDEDFTGRCPACGKPAEAAAAAASAGAATAGAAAAAAEAGAAAAKKKRGNATTRCTGHWMIIRLLCRMQKI